MRIEDVLERLQRSVSNFRFDDLVHICQYFFGNARITGSHHHFRTNWKGDPRINLQKRDGQAKPYQIKQVLEALQKLNEIEEEKKRQIREHIETKGGAKRVRE